MQDFADRAVPKFSVAHWREPLISRHFSGAFGYTANSIFSFPPVKKEVRPALFLIGWPSILSRKTWIAGLLNFRGQSLWSGRKGKLLVGHSISQSAFMTLKSLCYLAASSTDNFSCTDLWHFICVDKLLAALTTTEQSRLKCETDDSDQRQPRH